MLTSAKCPLDDKFKKWIDEIRSAVEEGYDDFARYLAELLIKEYGTHYLTKVKIGGFIYMDDYLSDTFWQKYKTSTTVIKQSSSKKFFGIFKVGGSSTSTITTSEFDSYQESVKKTKIDSVGGAYSPGMTLTDWTKTLPNNLVSIDRESAVLTNLISQSNFNNINLQTLLAIKDHVSQAMQIYMRVNARSGCTDRSSINYDPIANFDPEYMNNCKEKIKFGGTFASSIVCTQTTNGVCSATQYLCRELHPLTRDRKCPPGYIGKTAFLASNPWYNLTECFGSDSIQRGGALFGGIYSPVANNPVTGKKSCPENFTPISLFDCSKNVICLSYDFDRSIENAVPFGGFISSCLPQLQKDCAQGLEKYFVNSYNGCDLFYCTKAKIFDRPEIIEPPFRRNFIIPKGRENVVDFLTSLNKNNSFKII